MIIAETWSRADVAYDALTQAIYDGTFAPGAFIRIEQLAKQLDISITPTREALSRAAAQRLLVHDANRGFIVAPTLSAAEYRQLFATRRLLEGEAARAIEQPETTAEALRPHVERMRAELRADGAVGVIGYSRADDAFHRELMRGAGNRFLSIAWESLHFHLHVSRLYGRRGVTDAVAGVAEHEAIADALAAGDPARARRLVLDHVRGAEKRLRPLVAPTGVGAP